MKVQLIVYYKVTCPPSAVMFYCVSTLLTRQLSCSLMCPTPHPFLVLYCIICPMSPALWGISSWSLKLPTVCCHVLCCLSHVSFIPVTHSLRCLREKVVCPRMSPSPALDYCDIPVSHLNTLSYGDIHTKIPSSRILYCVACSWPNFMFCGSRHPSPLIAVY